MQEFSDKIMFLINSLRHFFIVREEMGSLGGRTAFSSELSGELGAMIFLV
jgi:hypothetical protein